MPECDLLLLLNSAAGGRTLPNCSTTRSMSCSATSWKFLTDAHVTRPLKLRQYALSLSFHLHEPRISTSSMRAAVDLLPGTAAAADLGGLLTRDSMRCAVPLPDSLVRFLHSAHE